jgi:hypothetical protein
VHPNPNGGHAQIIYHQTDDTGYEMRFIAVMTMTVALMPSYLLTVNPDRTEEMLFLSIICDKVL